MLMIRMVKLTFSTLAYITDINGSIAPTATEQIIAGSIKGQSGMAIINNSLYEVFSNGRLSLCGFLLIFRLVTALSPGGVLIASFCTNVIFNREI